MQIERRVLLRFLYLASGGLSAASKGHPRALALSFLDVISGFGKKKKKKKKKQLQQQQLLPPWPFLLLSYSDSEWLKIGGGLGLRHAKKVLIQEERASKELPKLLFDPKASNLVLNFPLQNAAAAST